MAARRLCAAFEHIGCLRSFAKSEAGFLQLRGVQSSAEAAGTAAAPTSSSRPAPPYSLLSERVSGTYEVETKPVFAVVELAGTQYKVTPNDTIVTEKLDGLDIHDRITLDRVLLAGTAVSTIIGRPTVPGITVTAAVEVGRKPGFDMCNVKAADGDTCCVSHHSRSNSWTGSS